MKNKKINFDLLMKNDSLIALIDLSKENFIEFLSWSLYINKDTLSYKKISKLFQENIETIDINSMDEFNLFYFNYKYLFNYYKIYNSKYFKEILTNKCLLHNNLYSLISDITNIFNINYDLLEILFERIYAKNPTIYFKNGILMRYNILYPDEYVLFFKHLLLKNSNLLKNEYFIRNELHDNLNEMDFLDNNIYINKILKLNFSNIKDNVRNSKYSPIEFNKIYAILSNVEKYEIDNIIIALKDINILNCNSVEILNINTFIILVANVDYYDLINKYNVSSIHTLAIFNKNKEIDCRLISHLQISEIQKNYNEYKNLILSGSKIGKAGLKYFLIKNKEKLTSDIIMFSLKKYPTFAKSLKINMNEYKDILQNKKEYEYDLKKLIMVDESILTEKEKKFIESKVDVIVNKYIYNSNYSLFVRSCILKLLINDFKLKI